MECFANSKGKNTSGLLIHLHEENQLFHAFGKFDHFGNGCVALHVVEIVMGVVGQLKASC